MIGGAPGGDNPYPFHSGGLPICQDLTFVSQLHAVVPTDKEPVLNENWPNAPNNAQKAAKAIAEVLVSIRIAPSPETTGLTKTLKSLGFKHESA
jgi:hypothetical protein